MDDSVLGLPLDVALERLAAAGQAQPTVEYTRAPRGEARQGTLRVVRQGEGRLVAARFPDRVEEEA